MSGEVPGTLLNALAAPAAKASPSREISREELTSAIDVAVAKVPEFRYVAEAARRLGVRVWLFGGTAASFGHYTKWDLARSRGDHSFQAERFDYDYTNIFRSTQDLDIVIDGNAEHCEKLEAELGEKYPHFLGSKTRWEVRGLRVARGEKEAILDNPNFSNQHSDSNSTGLIELTKPAAGQHRVRDARAWNDPNPPFLEDLRLGKLHYYFSEAHAETRRAKLGLNPPIFSVIRYLTKAFQYGLEIRPADLSRIKSIIADFRPAHDLHEPRAQDWLERNGKKLFMHAQDLDRAARTLDELGLREQLIHLKDNPTEPDSLAWWLNRKPLLDRPLGVVGQTAREFKLDVVAHETTDALAYESITRSPHGFPNVFESSDSRIGERSLYGKGFYTRIGTKGAANSSGITIRFKLNPEARLGQDFLLPADDYVLILNRRALEVLPESLDWTPADFLRFLQGDSQIKRSDRGLLEKLRRRMQSKLATLEAVDLDVLRNSVRQELLKAPPAKLNSAFLSEAFKFPSLLPDAADIAGLLNLRKTDFMRMENEIPSAPVELLRELISQTHWIQKVTADPGAKDLLLDLLKIPEESIRFELARTLLRRDDLYGIIAANEVRKSFLPDSLLGQISGWRAGKYVDALGPTLMRPEWAKSREAEHLLQVAISDVNDSEMADSLARIIDSKEWRHPEVRLRLVEPILANEHSVQSPFSVMLAYNLATEDPKLGAALKHAAHTRSPGSHMPEDLLSTVLRLLAPERNLDIRYEKNQYRLQAMLELARKGPSNTFGAPGAVARLIQILEGMEPILVKELSSGTDYDHEGEPYGYDIDGFRRKMSEVSMRTLAKEAKKRGGAPSTQIEILLHQVAKLGDRESLIDFLSTQTGSALPKPVALRLLAEIVISESLYANPNHQISYVHDEKLQKALKSPDARRALSRRLTRLFSDEKGAFSLARDSASPYHVLHALKIPGIDRASGFAPWIEKELRWICRPNADPSLGATLLQALVAWADLSKGNLVGSQTYREKMQEVYRMIFSAKMKFHKDWLRDFEKRKTRLPWFEQARGEADAKKYRTALSELEQRLRDLDGTPPAQCLSKAVRASYR